MARIYRIHGSAVAPEEVDRRGGSGWGKIDHAIAVSVWSFEYQTQSGVHRCEVRLPEIRVQTEGLVFAKKAVRLWRRSRRDRQWAARLQLIQMVRVFETPDARHQREALVRLRALDLSVS